jgi:aspartate kinase
MVIQNISSDQKTTDITFTVKRDDVSKTKEILKDNKILIIKKLFITIKLQKFQLLEQEWFLHQE